MAVRETISAFITPELRRFIRERLHAWHYGNASKVVRAALRLMIEQDQAERHPRTHTVS